MLRVRDTGPGLNDNEIAAAMAPFRTSGASDQTADGSVVNLSLTKALVEANRAQFHIKTAPHSGTLIEVVFRTPARSHDISGISLNRPLRDIASRLARQRLRY